MELYGAGFNAQGQLSSTSCPKDLLRFRKIAEGNHIRILCAVWNATVLEIDGIIHYRGFNELTGMVIQDEISGLPASRIKTVIGNNTNGILGALTSDGEVWLLTALESERLIFVKHEFPSGGYWTDENSKTIAHVAVADNEQVSVCTRSYPSLKLNFSYRWRTDSSIHRVIIDLTSHPNYPRIFLLRNLSMFPSANRIVSL